MGAEIPRIEEAISIPIESTKTKGFTPIYRNAKTIGTLVATYDENINTVKDILYSSLLKFKNKPFLGQIKLTITQSNGSKVQERTLQKFSLSQCVDMAEKIGSFLIKNNMQFIQPLHGMKLVGIYSKNRYEWCVSDMACILYGLTFVPLYQTLGIQNLVYCLEHSQMTTLFITAETIKTLLKLKGFGILKNLISFDKLPKQTIEQAQGKNFKIFYLSDILQIKQVVNHTQIVVKSKDCYTFSYTSGTTGPPKGAMISHGNMVSYLAGLKKHEMKGITQQDSYVSFMPLPHLLQRCAFVAFLEGGGFMAFYNGDIMKFKDDMAFIKPTFFIAVPRILNRIVQGVEKQFKQLRGIKSYLVRKGIQDKLSYLHQSGDYSYPLYDKLIFSKVRDAVGGRIRMIVTGSAPIVKHTYQMIKVLFGCPVYEGYGQTENTGLAFVQQKFVKQGGNVGSVVSSLQFKLSDVEEMNYSSLDKNDKGEPTPRGQIWLRGPVVFLGYYKDPERTKEALTEDGWLKTGDIGQLMPGTNNLKIIDRKKNIFKLQQGEYVAAEKVEAKYLKSNLVAEAYLHGESTQNFAIAIIVPNRQNVIKFAQNNGVSGSYEQICKQRKLRQLLCRQLDTIGREQGLMSFQQAKNVHIEPQGFMVRGIVSSTLKLQRFAGKKYYAKEILQMYQEGQLLVK